MTPGRTDTLAGPFRRALGGAGALAGAAALALFLPPVTFFQGEGTYAALHLAMELGAIVVSLLVFAVGWNALADGGVHERVVLACGLLAAGLIDLVHALSYQGMPPFVTPSSPEKAIVFWLAGRTVTALTLVAVATGWAPSASRRALLAMALGATALTTWVGLVHLDALPRTFIPGQGLTPFKVAVEWVLVATFLVAAWLLARRARTEARAEFVWLACASAVMALGEIFFTRYVRVSDVFNFLGHFYKIVAFAIIYRVVFVTGIRQPYLHMRALERKFRASFDQAFQFAALLRHDGTLVDLNQTARGSVPASVGPGALLIWQTPWWPEAERPRVEAAVRRAAGGETVRWESTYYTPAGALRHVDISLKPFFDDERRVEMLIAEGRDITRQKLQSDALRQINERLRQAVYVSGIGVFEHDHRAATFDWSDELRAMCGVAPDDAATLDLYVALMHPDDRAAMGAAIARAHDPAGDGVLEAEHRLVLRDDSVRWVAIRSQTTFDRAATPAVPVRTIGVVLDVTERKRAEAQLRDMNVTLEQRVAERTRELQEALQTLSRAQEELVRTEKLAALGSLVAGVAHELNTPLGNALIVASTLRDKSVQFERDTAAQTLRRSQLDDYVAMNVKAAELVMHNLTQAAELVSSFKQVAVDQTSAKRRVFDLHETLDEVLSTLKVLVKHRPVTLRVEIDAGLRMDSYPGPLGQVVTNLFSNALEHAFAPGTPGTLTLHARAGEAGRVVLDFADDGRGIDAADLPKIFDPFFTTRLGQGGSGLGLHIVHNIVTGVLGGRIAVDSRPGAGTRFTLDLPLVAPRPAEAKAA